MIIEVTVRPNKKRQVVTRLSESILQVDLIALPIDGRANQTLVEVLSDYFKVAKSLIEIKKGHKSSKKIVYLSID